MKKIFNSLSLFEKIIPLVVFIFLFYWFRSIDSNILLDPKLLNEGKDSAWMWKYLFQNGIMPLVYSLSLLFIFLGSKKQNIGRDVIELMLVLGFLFFLFGILFFAFCFFYYDFNIYLAITKGLISSLYIMFGILAIIFIIIM